MPSRAKSAAAAQAGSGASTPSTPSGPRYASRTAFDGLAIEGDNAEEDEEEDEDDEDEEEDEEQEEDKPLTRSAKKRAAKLAREDKRRQAKAAKGGAASPAALSKDSEGVLQVDDNDSRPPSQIVLGSAALPDTPARNTRAASAARSEPAVEPKQPAAEPPKTFLELPTQKETPMSRQSSATAAGAAQLPKPLSALSKEADSAAPAPAPASTADEDKAAEEKKAYWKKIYERTTFTFIMIFGFIGLLLMGHPYMIVLVMAIQTVVYREVTALFNLPGRPHITGYQTPAGNKTPNGSSVPEEDYFEVLRGRRRDELWSKTLSWSVVHPRLIHSSMERAAG